MNTSQPELQPQPTTTGSSSPKTLAFTFGLVVVAAVAGALATLAWLSSNGDQPAASTDDPVQQASLAEPSATSSGDVVPSSEQTIATATLPRSQWETSKIKLQPVSEGPFVQTIRLTGKVSLNEDRIAHIYPMVEGSVDRVSVTLGQVVQANDLLVVVHSREVGQAKLELYQAKLQHEMALVKDKLQKEIAANTKELLAALRKEKPITEIESQFRSRTMGDYRERLLLAYSSYLKSEADLERLEGVTGTGAISGKQLLAARSNRNADQATFQARIEQIEYELQTSLLLSSQAVKEAFTRVSVAATNLRILGCEDRDIESIDPVGQGEAISDYSIRAPFDGTVISKDVTLREQVRPDTQILSIANLDTVWITADIYEKDVPMLRSLGGKPVQVRNEAWPDRSFEAKIFYTGEIMDESTRTISMRAVAENEDHLLKPGMFVNIEFPATSDDAVLQVPLTAVQEHAGQSFVFVHRGEDVFERQDVTVGRTNGESAVIVNGLSAGQPVVTSGGFILKSKMLEDLMAEE